MTSWTYDPATGLNTAKRYPDGSRIGYAYADNGRRTRTTWARGVRRETAYDAANRVSGVTSSDGTPGVQYAYTSAGKVSEASVSGGVQYGYAYDARLLCTNEGVRSDGAPAVEVLRTFDRHRRPLSTAVAVTNALHAFNARTYDSEGRVAGYAFTNSFGRGVTATLAYDGSRMVGMTFALPNGGTFSTALTRSIARPDLVTRREYRAGGSLVYGCDTSFDLLGRPVNVTDSQSLARSYLYNRRSELAAATVGTNVFDYAYDSIGNRTASSANAVTNVYAANNLNQYVQITHSPTGPTGVSPVGGGATCTVPAYDADGNLTQDDRFAYAYDAENRLVSVRPLSPTEGALAVVNSYDHRHRRVVKRVERFDGDDWQTAETHRFVYDGCNIVLELIAFADGTARSVEYFWGNDLSGTEQGAGGVGGLLAVSADGLFYFPFYDHNGNVVGCVSESGAVAAQYVYDPYGNVIEQQGDLVDAFAFRFSTKYYDRETGMVGYQRRFYRPDLGRWLNRDPIEEEGGENLFVFCGNNAICYADFNGLAWRIKREGGVFAIAIPESSTDTFESLASVLHLDVSDYRVWAHTSDKVPIQCKNYLIPNLIVYDNGKRKITDYLPLSLNSVWHFQNERYAERDRKGGFMVRVNDNVTASQIENSLATDGLYRYTFTGHGDGYAGINSYPDPEVAVSPSNRHTKYGISSLTLNACGSAAIDQNGYNRERGFVRRNDWEINVARAGIFVGYEGFVTLLNHLFEWNVTRGANHGTFK